ncbi:MAG TPA: glycosyltransferase family 39 protein, partial [Anaerolineales bacterium]|nr:glycosyltransferase family 39 protein [Anaerolineales bacterium]
MDVGSRGNRTFLYLLVVQIAIGMSLVWYSTVWGAGLISDSFQYAASARNFARGNGFSLPYGDGELQPMTKYPPLFSVVLASVELLGGSAVQGARIINIVLFGVNIFLVFLSIQKLTTSKLFALLGSALFALSFVLVEVHSWALSEPLYICLGLTSFLVLQNYFEELQAAWLVFSALAVSLAFLTRYVGLSLVVSIVVILLLNRLEMKQKLRDSLSFCLIAILPAALWTLRGYLLTQTLNDRTIGLHPLTIRNVVNAIDVLYGWLVPVSFVQGREKIFLLLTAAALTAVILLLVRSNRSWLNDLVQAPGPRT